MPMCKKEDPYGFDRGTQTHRLRIDRKLKIELTVKDN